MTGFFYRARSHYRARPGFWFVPKLFGWGVTPVTWQGWLVTAIYIALAICLGKLAEHRAAVWLIPLIPLTLAFIALVWAKTDGAWAFRWGPDEQ